MILVHLPSLCLVNQTIYYFPLVFLKLLLFEWTLPTNQQIATSSVLTFLMISSRSISAQSIFRFSLASSFALHILVLDSLTPWFQLYFDCIYQLLLI